MFSMVEADHSAKIKVIGVGGAGGNAINNMIESGLLGVRFIAANTDAQSLEVSKAETRMQIGNQLTEGLGGGVNPPVGR
jgi:cell division protein FtsZ